MRQWCSHVWWLQGHHEPCAGCWPVPSRKPENILATLSGGYSNFYSNFFLQQLLQSEVAVGSFLEVCHHQHPQRAVPIHSPSIWNCLSSCCFLKNNRCYSPWSWRCGMLHRQHHCYWEDTWWAFGAPWGNIETSPTSWSSFKWSIPSANCCNQVSVALVIALMQKASTHFKTS